MQNPKALLCLVLASLGLTLIPFTLAHDGEHESEQKLPAGRMLGQLKFPTSTESAEAQAAFEQGMLLLHLFEYPYAEARFQKAQALDPGFAMAYWGEAMTHNHPIWDQQDCGKAMAVLDKLAPGRAARRELLTNAKERDFLESLEILCGPAEGMKPKAERDLAYERHYAEMARRYPDDHEVQLFYALALMGTHAGVRDIPAYMEAAALAQRVFYANRQHPGAAHYLIHAVDDPIHAPLGLEAARALFKMAPDAGHSLHMTSHIFTALGMWDDVILANENAVRVSNAMAAERGLPPRSVGHYNFWLLYGLLQQNRIADAKALLTRAYEDISVAGLKPQNDTILDPDDDPVGSLVQMWARYMLETGGSDSEVGAWSFDLAGAYDPTLTRLYVKGLLSPKAATIESALQEFVEIKNALRDRLAELARRAPGEALYLERLDVMQLQIRAMLEKTSGDVDKALATLREASRLEGAMPYSFGPPFVDYPSAQLLGELCLENGIPDEAAAAFTEQLQRSRGRRQALEGLRQATLKQ